MKKLPLTCAAIVAMSLASTAIAAPKTTQRTNEPNKFFTGPYIGTYGGYDWSDADVAGPNPDLDGWDYGVFAGFRLDWLMDRTNGLGIGLNGALEGFYGWSNSDDNVAGVAVEKDNEWGVSFRPGLSFLDRMTAPLGVAPYAILGYRNTEFDAFAGAASGSERYDGFELGIGTQLMAWGDVGLRAEYSHVWYGSENGIDPDADNLRLGLSYHF